MEKLVAVDMSRAWLLARLANESRKVLHDDWLSGDRRVQAAALYAEVGQDFNEFFVAMRDIEKVEMRLTDRRNLKEYVDGLPVKWYKASVFALESFRDNMDSIWRFAYSGKLWDLTWLTK